MFSRVMRALFVCSLFLSNYFCLACIKEFSFDEWHQKCKSLPVFSGHEKPAVKQKAIIDFEDFFAAFTDFNWVMSTILSAADWVDKKPTVLMSGESSLFYVQKKDFPAGSKIALHGDFHGDIHALNNCIKLWMDQGYITNDLTIKDLNFHLIFLGDYTDRGYYGAEVLYLVFLLKNKNPFNVFLIRGNHETHLMNQEYGFIHELMQKYWPSSESENSEELKIKIRGLCEHIDSIYQFMPLAFFIGANHHYVQCCHGGIEPGFDPYEFLNKSYQSYLAIKLLPKTSNIDVLVPYCEEIGANYPKEMSISNGFMWSDFIVDPQIPFKESDRGEEMYEFGKIVTQSMMDQWNAGKAKVHCIFRGHQHAFDDTDLMRRRILNLDEQSHSDDAGIGKLWIEDKLLHKKTAGLLDDVAVITFAVAPHTPYNFPYDSFGILTIEDQFKDWRLKVVRLEKEQNLNGKSSEDDSAN